MAWPLVGIGGVFVVMASMYVIVIALMFRIQGGRERAGTGRGSGLEQLVEGLRFIRGSAELRRLLTLGFVPMFLGMHYQMLMPAFALGLFDSGPEGLGLMNMSTGLGALVGTMALAAIGNVGWKERLQTGLGVAFGVALCAFGLAPTFVVALLLLPLVGGCSAAYQALNNTLVMEHTPRELYGRVMSVYMMSMSLMPLSTVPFGRLADEIGARPTVAGSGALLAVMVAIVAFGFARAPGRRLETAAPSRLH
jgi:MFS family permease